MCADEKEKLDAAHKSTNNYDMHVFKEDARRTNIATSVYLLLDARTMENEINPTTRRQD
ncbi:6843_t:CDS:2 [Acaulospora morrowiae]|uniref:6843_t:CDS:1 n=1 Tax=Acaulospora morrowiae TaxID=94023 RepID=A0A9N9I7S8_9GLOM|nr:6843_t:CDS:2 [Acaulospora morrowiae]